MTTAAPQPPVARHRICIATPERIGRDDALKLARHRFALMGGNPADLVDAKVPEFLRDEVHVHPVYANAYAFEAVVA